MNKYNYNDKGQRHGYWKGCFSNGNLSYKGKYINGFATGYWEWHDDKGELIEKQFYL